MRDAITRFTAPLWALLPDFSAAPARREATFGITVSIVFHLLLLLVVIVLGGLLPERLLVDFARSKPSLQEVELTIVPPEPSETRTLTIEQLEQERRRDIIESRGLAKAQEAPKDPAFESDENMKAASELAARGDAPLPSQDGRTDRNSPDFANAQAMLGKSAPAEPDVPLEPAKAATPDAAPAAEQAPPPEPVKATPPPAPVVPLPNADQIALSPPVATPVPEPPLPKVAMRATTQVALINPPPRPQASSGYQPMQEKTRVDGVISNRGKAAVDAVKTPLARYQKQVNDAIGSRWYYYVHQRMDLIAMGSARISFAIDARGKVNGVTVETNSSNSSFADVCERAVREAEIAPPPPEVAAELRAGQLDRSITFTFYNN